MLPGKFPPVIIAKLQRIICNYTATIAAASAAAASAATAAAAAAAAPNYKAATAANGLWQWRQLLPGSLSEVVQVRIHTPFVR